jgi:acetylornithine deacetylase/succinyl-diaminopimelate desuccinylase-like protein
LHPYVVERFKITRMTMPADSLSHDSIAVTLTKEKVAARFPSALAHLGNLVRIPGIAWDAFDAQNLEQSAEAVATLFRETGVFEMVEIRRAMADGKMGAPAVVARRAARNGRPQILLYAHHDVQPPGDLSVWKTPEFEPTLIDGRIFGRGAADDKAGIVTHLTAVQTLVDMVGEDFEIGLSVFIEGEEEAGSPSFRNFLEENRDVLEADVIVVADSANWTTTIPALTTTLRGLVSQVIEVQTLDHAVHSGMFGGAVPDAMTATIKLLASLHDEVGDVAVEGLHSTKASNLDFTEEQLRIDSGLLDGVSMIGRGSILDRIWTKPSITVIGIDAMSVAMSSNTLLPSVKAKISMRIAPGQEPADALALLRAHLEKNTPFGAKLSYGEVEKGKPFEAKADGWAKQLANASLSAAFGNESVDIGIGGSIPFIADLLEVFPSAQILVTGVEDADSRAHSPNESVHVDTLRGAMVAESLFLIKGNELRVN